MIPKNHRTVIQVPKFILPFILQYFLPSFFPQFHRVFAKIFIDENTVFLKSLAFFKIFVSREIIVDGRFWFFFLNSRWQRSVSICSFILSLLLINSRILISQSSQVLFSVSAIWRIRKLFRLDLSSNSINFEDTSFGSKRSSSIPLILFFRIFKVVLNIVYLASLVISLDILSRRLLVIYKLLLIISLILVSCFLNPSFTVFLIVSVSDDLFKSWGNGIHQLKILKTDHIS